ncbi:hypothetical protein GCM10027403_06210 [Arthrobacter tecti]
MGTHPEVFDYTRTARRREWSTLPESVRSRIEVRLGSPVGRTMPAGGGFTPGFAAIVESAERSLFVKAAPSSDKFIHDAYVREQAVLELLPPHLPVPHLRAAFTADDDDAEWQVLCFETIHGYMPGTPWTEADLGSIHESLVTIQDALAGLPRGVTGGPMSAGLSDDPEVSSIFHRLGASGELPAFLTPWTAGRLNELQALCNRSADALRGDAILHNDLRADNVIIQRSDKRAFVCDWNFLARGPAWADWVGLLLYARHGGIDPRPWLRDSPLSAAADPDDVDSWLAVLAAYMTHYGMQPDLPSSPMLRAHGRFTARIILDWIAERRWP